MFDFSFQALETNNSKSFKPILLAVTNMVRASKLQSISIFATTVVGSKVNKDDAVNQGSSPKWRGLFLVMSTCSDNARVFGLFFFPSFFL